jgi:hypothetical protein
MANFGALGTLRRAYQTLIKPSTSALAPASCQRLSLLGTREILPNAAGGCWTRRERVRGSYRTLQSMPPEWASRVARKETETPHSSATCSTLWFPSIGFSDLRAGGVRILSVLRARCEVL